MQPTATEKDRVVSIDVVRGLVMVFMALDHVRYWFTDVPFSPENLDRTWPMLFYTRWVTHLCAPGFFFLAGVSAWLSGRRSTGADTAGHLRRRGLWLVFLEITVIGFAWSFYPGYSFAGVIWSLGWSMVALSLFVRLGSATALVIGAGMMIFHHALEAVPVVGDGFLQFLWRVLYVPGYAHLPGTSAQWFVLFPIIPWVGVMLFGYGLGPLFARSRAERAVRLTAIGTVFILAFLVLRTFNLYGYPSDPFSAAPARFEPRGSGGATLMALLDVEKYPPSLQFLLVTLGTIFLLLGVLEAVEKAGTLQRPLIVFGRVPMFFYILHLYLIHAAAIVVGAASGQSWAWLVWNPDPSRPGSGYGHGLDVVHAVWVGIVVLLWIPSRWFAGVRSRHHRWWLRYL